MEWVVTTAKTIDEAKHRALDQLGVAADEAEFEVVEEPKTGLFGRVKSEARIRARVKPTQVRPKQDRRDRKRGGKQRAKKSAKSSGQQGSKGRRDQQSSSETNGAAAPAAAAAGSDSPGRGSSNQTEGGSQRPKRQRAQKEKSAMNDETQESTVTPQEVGDAAVAFMTGLTDAIGADAQTEVSVDGTEIDVKVSGSELGLLVGPGGRTLTAVQDLARVASQRRLGDHDTRLRIDVGGYREKRRAALEKFAVAVADQVKEAGAAKALEPMSSADRKVVHDAIAELDGVSSRSEGDDPSRRVVITPE